MGRLGSSLSHLLLALSTSLQEVQVNGSFRDICKVSLQAFAYQRREWGRLMATLIHTRRHAWLAQLSLMEVTRELFGSATLTALDRTPEADITRRRLAALHRRAPVSWSGSSPFPAASQGPQRVFSKADRHRKQVERKLAVGERPAVCHSPRQTPG